MDNETNHKIWSVTFFDLLLLLFIGLKLSGAITWSWWWVLSPALIPLSIALLVLLIVGIWYMTTKVE